MKYYHTIFESYSSHIDDVIEFTAVVEAKDDIEAVRVAMPLIDEDYLRGQFGGKSAEELVVH